MMYAIGKTLFNFSIKLLPVLPLLQFGARKMGDGDVSNAFRERLERDLDNLQTNLQSINISHKPVPPVQEVHHHHYHDSGLDCIIM